MIVLKMLGVKIFLLQLKYDIFLNWRTWYWACFVGITLRSNGSLREYTCMFMLQLEHLFLATASKDVKMGP